MFAPTQPPPKPVKESDLLSVEIVNLASYDTVVLEPPYQLAVEVEYSNGFTNPAHTARVELHQTDNPALLDGGLYFLAAATGLAADSDGTVVFLLHFPYDTTDFPLIPRIVREDDPAEAAKGLPRVHLCVISGGM